VLQQHQLEDLIKRLGDIRRALTESEAAFGPSLQRTHPTYTKSARNLAHYIALRHRDIRHLQQELAEMGLSSLGRAEAHVMATMDAVAAVVHSLAGRQWQQQPSGAPGFGEGNKLLREHTEALLGPAPANRSVRIMVTMPGEAASDYPLVRELVAGGMNCMRINCSYDDRHAWSAMAEHLAHARNELGKECRILMDLAGPKLRVGAIELGPEVVKIRPQRDVSGNVAAPARFLLVTESRNGETAGPGGVSLPVVAGAAQALEAGDVLEFMDARGASRKLFVTGRTGGCVQVECGKTAYFASGIELRRKGAADTVLRVGRLPAVDQPIVLAKGDTIVLSGHAGLGKGPEFAEDGRVSRPATITCTIPEILNDLRAGERIWFDDGKIGGIIKQVSGSEATIEVTYAALGGSKLRGNKGINLPDSNLRVASLTPKDLEDLPVVAAHADIVGMSFVRSPEDVQTLETHLDRLKRPDLGILLKIETRKAFDNLPYLVLAAMHRPAAGVMIARGDLAVECGYERMAEVQEEILWVCEAAHMPVVWATQVLESLAKKGQPSRAEITDAAMGERAECVMLNKGPHLCDAVGVLDDILQRMQHHQVKKSAMLRQLMRW
jgi:pyruvate kinase